ncbi:hypothetical protein V5049_10925 [Moellerella wisconsensis]|uniref:hypothetical protein n=1 Tax=Moellerella wisconsensis TaxID=158849 RepID=UPI0030764E63
MNKLPDWFEIGEKLMKDISDAALIHADNLSDLEYDKKVSIQCSVYHYIQCLMSSIEENRIVNHAIALSTIRQSVEALTLIECGFLKNRKLSDQLIDSWISGKKTSGAIRKILSQNIWPTYTKSLWGKNWTEYYSEFCKSIQPYAHYSRELQGWQLAINDNAKMNCNGHYVLNAKFGFNTYDSSKATRLTLFHVLLSWTLGKIITNNIEIPDLKKQLEQLQIALELADELGKGKLSWAQQFWSLEFTKPVS